MTTTSRLRADAPDFVPTKNAIQQQLQRQSTTVRRRDENKKTRSRNRQRRKKQQKGEAAAATTTTTPREAVAASPKKKKNKSHHLPTSSTGRRRKNKKDECNNTNGDTKNHRRHCRQQQQQHQSFAERTTPQTKTVVIEDTVLLQPAFFPALVGVTTEESSSLSLPAVQQQPKKAVWRVATVEVVPGSDEVAVQQQQQQQQQAPPPPPPAITIESNSSSSSSTSANDEDDNNTNGMTVLRRQRQQQRPLLQRLQPEPGKGCSGGILVQQQQQQSAKEMQQQILVSSSSLQTTTTTTTTTPVMAAAAIPQRRRNKPMDMTKLRDRWWSLLREHNERKVQLRRRREEEEAAALLLQQRRQTESSESSSFVNNDTQQHHTVDENYFATGDSSIRVPAQDDDEARDYYDRGDNDDDSLSSSTSPSSTTTTTSSSSSSFCNNDHYYAHVDLPLHEAIQRNDAVALERLLRSSSSSSRNNNASCRGDKKQPVMSPLQLAVQLDRPQLVRILCAAAAERRKARGAAGTTNTLKKNSSSEYDPGNCFYPPPLLLAAECGFEECLQILLASSGGTSGSAASLLLATRDSQGNTALHCCCRGETTSACSTFNLLLDHAATSSSASASSSSSSNASSSSFLFKILSCKNDQQQTPLHVACEYGRADIVDAILTTTTTHRGSKIAKNANLSVLSKLFALQDIEQQTPMLAAVAAGSTDIVMSLLMWRGNNNNNNNNKHAYSYYKRRSTQSSLLHGLTNNNTTSNNCGSSGSMTDAAAPCPLIWAVRARNVDMVQLLLEFNDHLSGSGYNLNAALHVAVNNDRHKKQSSSRCCVNDDDDDDEGNIRSEIARILVDAGANPCCAQQDETKHTVAASARSTSSCALAVAATNHDSACLVALLDSYRLFLDRLHSNRRRDPKLQKQPESFFVGMESVENAEMKSAMRESLVVALFHAWKASSSTTAGSQSSSAYIACALALYRRETHLLQVDMERLKTSLVENTLKPSLADTISVPVLPAIQYEACYPRIVGSCRKEKGRESALYYLSQLMLDLPWFESDCATMECAWIASQAGMENTPGDNASFSKPDIVLVCQDGERFQAHSFVLSHSSDKLAAAIHFASMSREQNDCGKEPRTAQLTEIQMDQIAPVTCRRMLDHMYHGSIGGGLSRDRYEACQELLELVLVAEEYLCRSLVQECEMRLLSSDHCSHGCYCCYCRSKASQIKTEPQMNTAECFYRVTGPSCLVTPAEALDVLAVVQHVAEACCETDYSLRLVSSNKESTVLSASPSDERMKGIIRNPLESLREVALVSVLSDFDAVARSSAFASQFEDMLDNKTNEMYAQEMLLRMSLQDLSEVVRSSQGSPEVKPSTPVISKTSIK